MKWCESEGRSRTQWCLCERVIAVGTWASVPLGMLWETMDYPIIRTVYLSTFTHTSVVLWMQTNLPFWVTPVPSSFSAGKALTTFLSLYQASSHLSTSLIWVDIFSSMLQVATPTENLVVLPERWLFSHGGVAPWQYVFPIQPYFSCFLLWCPVPSKTTPWPVLILAGTY